MALNLVGLGFTFGAEDKGAIQFQKTLIDGFKQITESMTAMSQSASGDFSRSMGGMDEKASDMSDSFNRSVEDMGERIGIDFPEAAESGADRFSSSSEIIARAQDKIADGFASMKDMSFKLNQILSTNRLSTFIQAINMKKLGEIGDGLGNIGTAGRNLTTGFEAQAQELSVSARKTGANLGLTGAALGKFTKQAAGMAFALQIDAGEAGQAVRNFEWAATQLGAVGIKSASDLAKVSMVTGVSAGELAVSVRRMSQEFDLSDESIQKLYGSFTAMGQEMFDVGGSIKQIPQILDLLRQAAHASGRELTQMEMQQFATGTAAAARAFFEFTQDGNKAYEMAMQLGQTIVSTRKDFRNLFAGVGSEMPQMLRSIGIAAGDINTSFDLMSQGPDGFMKGLAMMVGQVKKRGGYTAQFASQLAARLEEAVGEEQANMLLTFFSKADQATLDAMASIQDAQVELGKLGREGWSSSRTLQESYEMARDSMIAQFRSISSARVEFVRNSAKEFASFAKAAKKLAAEGGPLGLVIEKLSAIHSIGMVGVLPKSLHSIGAAFGEVVNEALPMLTMLGAMGFRLRTLVNPIALVGMGIAALGVNFAAAYKEAGPLMKNTEAAKKQLMGLGFVTEQQRKSATRMDVAFALLKTKVEAFALYVVEWVPKIYNALVKGFLDISKRLLKFASTMDLEKTFADVFGGIKIKGSISKAIEDFADDVMLLFSDALNGKSPKAKTMLGQVMINLTAAFVKIFKKVGDQLKRVQFGKYFKDAIRGLWKGLTGQMDPKSSEGASSTEKIAGAIGSVIGAAMTKVRDFVFTKLLPATMDLVGGIFQGLAGGFDPKSSAGASASSKMGMAIGDTMKTAFGKVKEYLKGYFKQWWQDVGDIWADPSASFKEKIQGTIGKSGGIIAGGLVAMKVGAGPASKALEKLSSVGMAAVVSLTSIAGLGIKIAAEWGTLSTIFTSIGTALGGVSAATVGLYAAAVAAAAAIGGLAIGFIFWPKETQSLLDSISGWFKGFGEKIGKFVVDWGPTIVYWMTVGIPIELVKNAPAILLAIGKALSGIHKIVTDLVDGILMGMKEALKKKFPAFASTFDTLFNGLSTGFKWLTKIGSYLIPIWGQIEAISDLVEAWGDDTSSVGKWFRDLWDTVKKGFSQFLEWISPVTDILKKVGEIYVGMIVTQFKVLWTIGKAVFSVIAVGATAVWEALKLVGYVIYRVIRIGFLLVAGVAKMVWEKIKEAWGQAVDWFYTLYYSIYNAAVQVWGIISSAITSVWETYIKPVWEPIAQWFSNLFTKVWEFLFPIIGSIQSLIIDAWVQYIKPVWDKVSEFFSGLFTNMWTWAKESIDKVVGFFTDAKKKVKEFFDGLEEMVTGAFKNSIHHDAEESLNKMVSYFETAFNEIAEKAFGLLDEMTEQTFENIILGAQLMRDEMLMVLDEVGIIAEDSFVQLADTFAATSEDISQTFMEMLEGIFITFSETFQTDVIDVVVAGFVDAFEQVTQETTKFIRTLDEKFTKFAKDFARTILQAMLVSMAFVSEAVGGIENDLDRMIGQMKKLTRAIQQAAEAQASAHRTAASDIIKETEEERKKLQDLPQNMKVLGQFINRPAWTAGYELSDVVANLQGIKAAVENLKTVQTGGPRGRTASEGAANRILAVGKKYGLTKALGG